MLTIKFDAGSPKYLGQHQWPYRCISIIGTGPMLGMSVYEESHVGVSFCKKIVPSAIFAFRQIDGTL